MNLPQLFTAQEVANSLNIARGTVYSMVSRGEIDSYKIGRTRRFSAEQIDEFKKRQGQIVWTHEYSRHI